MALRRAPRRGAPPALRGGRTRTLKNLLQEAAVPEWQREHLPLLYRGERLAWVPGIGIAAEARLRARRAGARSALAPGVLKAHSG